MINAKNTVLENVINECNSAFTAKIPIIYLLTDEMELIDDIVNAQTMVEFLKNIPSEGFVSIEEYIGKQDSGDDFKKEYTPDNYKSGDLDKFPFIINNLKGRNVPEIGVIKNFNLYPESKYNVLTQYIHQYINSPNDSYIKNSILILAAPILKIPIGLEPYIEVIAVPHLEDFEIEDIIVKFAESRNEVLVKEYLGKLIDSMKGFSKSKINMILKKVIFEAEYLANNQHTKGRRKEEQPEIVSFKIIKNEKEQMLKKTGLLKLIKREEISVGGLNSLIDWLNENKIILNKLNEAKQHWNIDFPKGILIAGIPGSGKTLMAKKAAQMFNIPLIKMDMGALMGSHIGESENNMRTAMEMAEAMSPCVLWIDELEKSFAGVKGSGDGDSGTLKRVFASFLTWMQENTYPCFIFATANDISTLPPEFLRRGRFDQKFYVYMPMRVECIEIFSAVLNKLNKPKNEFDEKFLFEERIFDSEFLGQIVDSCVSNGRKKFLTGADIEGIVKDALKSIFLKKCDMKVETKYKISSLEMRRELENIISEVQTYGETNLREIAECYISLSRHKFKPASGNNTDRVLFAPDEFAEDKEKVNDAVKRKCSLYDNVLYDTLRDEIYKIINEQAKNNLVE